MRNVHVVRGLALAATAFPLVLASVAGTATAASISIGTARDGTQLSFPNGGEVFHVTSNPVQGLGFATVPGSLAVAAHWGEVQANGTVQHYYAVSLDGRTLAGRVRETDHVIEMQYANFDPLVTGEPAIDPALRARAGNELFLVQLWSVPLEDYYKAIEAVGGTFRMVQGHNVLVVQIDPAKANQLAQLPFVRWVGAYHPAYKLDEAGLQALTVGTGDSDEARWSINVWERGNEMQNAMKTLIEAGGGTVHYLQPDLYRFEATMNNATLLELVHRNEVHVLDVWLGFGGPDMDIGRQLLGSAFVQTSPLKFDGTGVRGEIFDTELCTTHTEWKNAPIIHSTGTTGSSHGTSCYGICFARGANPTYKGHMPEGQGIFYRYNESTQFGGAKSRLQIAQESVNPAGPYRSVFQTSSVGSPQVSTYTTLSAEMDTVIFETDYLHCQSQSNLGNTNSRPQAWAKNMMSGGAVDHVNTLTRADDNVSGASTGPASDGRIKPTLAGFYDSIATTSGCSYTSGFGGTSGGTPMVCGTTGIFQQMWHEGVWPGYGGGASVFDDRAPVTTVIAALVNTAYRYPYGQNGLDRFRQAWGMPDLANLYNMRDKTVIVKEDPANYLKPLQTYTIEVEVASGEPALNVSMMYIDVAGNPNNQSQHRVNDLSLRVTAPGGFVYWGNNGLTSSNFSTAGGSSNTKDTLENVFIQNPQAGTWKIEVIGDEIVVDTGRGTGALDAGFSLWVTGAVEAGGCYADCDGNGTLDLFDFLCFVNEFNSGNKYADCDGNGTLDLFDFLCFVNEFNGGCP
jgi:hypothetical protein